MTFATTFRVHVCVASIPTYIQIQIHVYSVNICMELPSRNLSTTKSHSALDSRLSSRLIPRGGPSDGRFASGGGGGRRGRAGAGYTNVWYNTSIGVNVHASLCFVCTVIGCVHLFFSLSLFLTHRISMGALPFTWHAVSGIET